ncbi:cupin domain-containing protein [Haloplanus pelagicus]|jgi:mannose-6-phosphate isomerase-like protein (cupin superfamily)|uniref:cupin domain-containing protein n=1 Tax=Haloplanus pelagicus TaxID=2949995 RepID=UPI00203E85D5|nr:cupin domain-containing protein [Haloplanus sp. HW8-1]
MDHSQSYHLYDVDEPEVRDRLGIDIQFLMNVDQGDTQMFDQGIITVDPGESVTPHVHRYSGETFYGLDGEGEIVVDGESVPCHADDHLVFIPPGVPHYPRNPADRDGPFRAMFIHSPAVLNGDTYTVDEDGNPADLEK